MTLFFLTEFDGVWHYRENGKTRWQPVWPECRSLARASRIVKKGDPRNMVAVVPRLFRTQSGKAAR